MRAFKGLGTFAVLVAASLASAADNAVLSYHEPFGVKHSKEIIQLPLAQPLVAGEYVLLDEAGNETPSQPTSDGKSLLVRTDLKPGAMATWHFAQRKPGAPAVDLVQTKQDTNNGWYEISNGLTAIRISTGKGFVDETAGLSAAEISDSEKHESHPGEIRRRHEIKPSEPAPVQGIRLRDGRWTAKGPNIIHAVALFSAMKVEFVEEGPIETVVRVTYQFKGKPLIPLNKSYPITSPGYPGGDGHYVCTIKIQAGQPSIWFEEDSDVMTSWRLNLYPELNFDTARHPERQKNGQVKESDFAVPYDADYQTSYLTQEKGIVHLMPWGNYLGEYYWMLYNSAGNGASPAVGVFADKSGDAQFADASGPGMVCSNNWMGTGAKGGGFNVQINRGTPDARTFPFVKFRWGLYVGQKSDALAELGKTQPVAAQMDLMSGLVPLLRNVTAQIPQIPQLKWEERSDWLNVKTKVTPKAVGDGVADDTAALQAALNSFKPEGYDAPNTVYLPPGTYRITHTLRWEKLFGKRIIGHGRDTHIVWDGDGSSPPVMFHSNGVTAGVLFEGIVWDGAGKAEYGVNHCSATKYESHVTHRNEAFINMKSGIVTSFSEYFPYKSATAEVLFDNCLFVNDGVGLGFGSYNALDNTVINCAFYYCGRPILNSVGNVYVRRCEFVGSLDTDIWTHVGDCSATRCTSVGSRRFLHAGGQLFVLQDCHVDGWLSTKGAIERSVNSPLTMFDCTFSHPPDAHAPVQGGPDAAVLISNCKNEGADAILNKDLKKHAIDIPAGRLGGAVTSLQPHFFHDSADVAGKVFDARRDFGASGNGKADDTNAIVAAVNAARQHGHGAVAYLPVGNYHITKTIDLTGSNYTLSGAGNGWGCGTIVTWAGKKGAADADVPMFHIYDANHVTVADFAAATPSNYFDDFGVVSFLQTPAVKPSFVTYDDVAGFVQFRHLGQADRVNIQMISGIIDIDNCQRATILAEQIYPSRHPQSRRFNTTLIVRGNSREPKDGLLGIMTMFNAGNPYDITIKDSQSLVISDYYTEQTQRVLLLEGNPGDTPGRFTLLAHKFHSFGADDLVQVRNYNGAMMLGASFLPQPPATGTENGKKISASMTGAKQEDRPFIFSHEGTNPLDVLLVGCHYVTGEPILRNSPAAHFVLANDTVANRPGPWHITLSDAEKQKIAAALDHLRQLGQVDVAFRQGLPKQ